MGRPDVDTRIDGVRTDVLCLSLAGLTGVLSIPLGKLPSLDLFCMFLVVVSVSGLAERDTLVEPGFTLRVRP